MNEKTQDLATACVRENRVHDFYVSAAWRKKREEILKRDKYECQLCKAKGKYSRAEIVHHVRHLRDHPQLALCDTYTDERGDVHRQLLSVCRTCHENDCHPERMKTQELSPHFRTEERWD